jgi:transketolase N-terminal domain/subunit/transketolase C-terminal domain/subunit
MLSASVKNHDFAQEQRNAALIAASPTLGARFDSRVLPFTFDPTRGALADADRIALTAIEKTAARIAIQACASLGRAGDIDHMGGSLDLIPALTMTLAAIDHDRRHYTIEHGHTSIGYYAVLAAFGYIDEKRVIDAFRRSLDIAGHVSWVPGGTELSSGRLGVIVPVAVGQALGLRAHKGDDALVICHTGDAGWISGQALNGWMGASLHHAPAMFVMHRNGVQLSAPTEKVVHRDARAIVKAIGLEVLEIDSIHDHAALAAAYAEGFALAKKGQPSMIYPTGFKSDATGNVTLQSYGEKYGLLADVEAAAKKQNIPMSTEVWVPGALMSFRDAHSMVECLFYVNNLPGGEGQHDGGMKGRDEAKVLSHPLLQLTAEESAALDALRNAAPRIVTTTARPDKGASNLVLTTADLAGISLPGTDKPSSARAGSEAAYAAVAKKFPNKTFVVSCDLDPSTKLGKAVALIPKNHHFEMSIEEQASALMANGLAFSSREPQLNVVSTFAAFMEGIAREGFEFWRYQRNLTGRNEGLNVVMHLSHVGANTGRDHFSGWSLDWINLALGYLPFLYRFYAPADARAAFIAVRDAAATYGGHIVAIPRDTIPVLAKQGSKDPLWEPADAWSAVTRFRSYAGAKVAVLTIGAPSYLAGDACDNAMAQGVASDVFIINGFPLPENFMSDLASKYDTVVTLEDGLIGTHDAGLRGFAAFVAGHLAGKNITLRHFGIGNPQVAPSETFVEVWKHFGITAEALTAAIVDRA